MTTQQLKNRADKWMVIFRIMASIDFVFVILSAIWPIFNVFYAVQTVFLVICGFRMKMWNDKLCNQRNNEYYETRKIKALNDLEYDK